MLVVCTVSESSKAPNDYANVSDVIVSPQQATIYGGMEALAATNASSSSNGDEDATIATKMKAPASNIYASSKQVRFDFLFVFYHLSIIRCLVQTQVIYESSLAPTTAPVIYDSVIGGGNKQMYGAFE